MGVIGSSSNYNWHLLTVQEEDQVSAVEDMSDAPPSELEASPTDSATKSGEHSAAFGESMNVLKLNPTEVTLLRKSFDMLLVALGNDREAVPWRSVPSTGAGLGG
eukprot:s4550_g6.t1